MNKQLQPIRHQFFKLPDGFNAEGKLNKTACLIYSLLYKETQAEYKKTGRPYSFITNRTIGYRLDKIGMSTSEKTIEYNIRQLEDNGYIILHLKGSKARYIEITNKDQLDPHLQIENKINFNIKGRYSKATMNNVETILNPIAYLLAKMIAEYEEYKAELEDIKKNGIVMMGRKNQIIIENMTYTLPPDQLAGLADQLKKFLANEIKPDPAEIQETALASEKPPADSPQFDGYDDDGNFEKSPLAGA